VGFVKLHRYAALSLAVEVRIKNWAKNGDGGGEKGDRGKKKKMSKQTDTSKDKRYEQQARNSRFSLSVAFSLSLSSQRANLESCEVSSMNATSLSSYDDIKKYI